MVLGRIQVCALDMACRQCAPRHSCICFLILHLLHLPFTPSCPSPQHRRLHRDLDIVLVNPVAPSLVSHHNGRPRHTAAAAAADSVSASPSASRRSNQQQQQQQCERCCQSARACACACGCGSQPWGNGHIIPRGPLREPLRGLSRAHAVVVHNADMVSAALRSTPHAAVLASAGGTMM